MLERLKLWARAIQADVVALWIAARDPRTPLVAKLVAAAIAAYALSPIDLVPDFIPLIGYLDDLVIVPAGIWLAIRLIPPGLMREFRAAAAARPYTPGSRVAARVITAIWIAVAVALGWYVLARYFG